MSFSNLIKATILVKNNLWVAIFEREDAKGYAVAKQIFGTEPSSAELYNFITKEYKQLNFSSPQENIALIIRRINPKRMQRIVRKEMERAQSHIPMTRAQEALKLDQEKNKISKKVISKAEKLAHEERRFELKQLKKKQKMRGH